VIPKGAAAAIKARGIEAFRADIVELLPPVRDRVQEIRSFDDVKLLTVQIDRLLQWHRPGLLCIGDAAHAMSPVAGVGVNLAVQDAVAAANLLHAPLRAGKVDSADLEAVQRRRMFPTRATQRMQVFMQNNFLSRVLAGREKPVPPWPVRLLTRCPRLQRIPARLVGIGVRAEHIASPDVLAAARS
jgi:2-polyprenyl-6-methoxyphenol hydroxylase-like FAD-dependent oxidoreductase